MPWKIPHGNTYAERKNYADVIRGKSTAYWEVAKLGSGKWVGNPKNPGSKNDKDVVLVEVWELSPGKIHIHPSRNSFHWVGDKDAQKQLWHELATGETIMRMFQGAMHSLAKRMPVASTSSHKRDKPPGWAVVTNLIGYTSDKEILLKTGDLLSQVLAAKCESVPSVYYKDGHATIDHQTLGNIGWESFAGCVPLFFGNVPAGWVE